MLHELGNEEYVHPKRRPIGLYDNTFICSNCDGKFGDDETYTGSLLGKFRFSNDDLPGRIDENKVIYIDDVQWEKVYRCFLFLTWKAHHSGLLAYSCGDIIASRIRDSLRAESGSSALGDHEIVISYYHDFESGGDLFIPPQNERFRSKDGYRNVVKMPIGRCIVYMRTDGRKFLDPIRQFVIRERAILFPHGFAESGMFGALNPVVVRNLPFRDGMR